MFDCPHGQGDPVGTAAHVPRPVATDGTSMIVEPRADDRLEGNLNPAGRVLCSASTMVCVGAPRRQEVRPAPPAGEARIRDAVERRGFTRFPPPAAAPRDLASGDRR